MMSSEYLIAFYSYRCQQVGQLGSHQLLCGTQESMFSCSQARRSIMAEFLLMNDGFAASYQPCHDTLFPFELLSGMPWYAG